MVHPHRECASENEERPCVDPYCWSCRWHWPCWSSHPSQRPSQTTWAQTIGVFTPGAQTIEVWTTVASTIGGWTMMRRPARLQRLGLHERYDQRFGLCNDGQRYRFREPDLQRHPCPFERASRHRWRFSRTHAVRLGSGSVGRLRDRRDRPGAPSLLSVRWGAHAPPIPFSARD